MATISRKKNYLKMSAAELAAETAQFDEEFAIDQSRPMTASERAQWDRVKRKPGRPKVGEGTKSICVTIERAVLRQADRLAKTLGVSRGQLFTAGLVALFAEEAARRSRRK